MIVSCDCGAKLKIDESKIAGKRVKVRCPRCGNILPLYETAPAVPKPAPKKTAALSASTGPLVLVAHDSEVVRYMVHTILTGSGFRVEMASNSFEVLKKAAEMKPRGLILDVGLPGIYGFELCERLKGNPATKGIKIILLSSVYDKRRYKRTPASLYGADDYIEKHHIPDYLPAKLRRLLSPDQGAGATPPKTAEPSPSDLPEVSRPPAREFEPSLLNHGMLPKIERNVTDQAPQRSSASRALPVEGSETTAILPESISLDASIFQKEECDIPRFDAEDPEAVEKARRFARIIVSDVALYNQELVIEGIRNGTFFELLRNDVEEGRELYMKRVPAVIRAKKDYYQEAFDNFICAAKKKNVR